MIRYFIPAFLVFLSAACSSTNNNKGSQAPLTTVNHFSPKKYAGQWHEIARLPNFFERGVVAARATYQVLPDGRLSVFNEGLKANGKRTSIRGIATPVGRTPDGEAKLKVRFNRFPASLFAGDYWVLDLNRAHTHAIVGSPNRKFLWLLSKDPTATPLDFSKGIERMKTNGFRLDQLITNPRRIK
ncbi:MAG: lipocalin family protein [Verrucomicrobiae bacterium]|nr:lipocalin family protein [Verrucomicrobiae bacterium]NNJ87316.1 lipocalin family protein [Akkermansiaceae bacterium]